MGGGARYLRYFIGGGQITAQLGGGSKMFLLISHWWNHLVAVQIDQSTWNQETNNSAFYLQLRTPVQIACIENFHYFMGGGPTSNILAVDFGQLSQPTAKLF